MLEGDEREIVKSASQRLMDFLVPYAILSLQTPSTPKSGRASVVQGWEWGGYAPSIAWEDFTIRLAVEVGEEQMQEALERAQAILEVLETEPRQTAFLRNAFHYAFVASQADRNEDKLINLVISIEALYLHSEKPKEGKCQLEETKTILQTDLARLLAPHARCSD